MLEASFPTIGTLDETLPATSDPQYQSAALCLSLHKIIKAISDEGFTITKPEASDFSSYSNNVKDYIDKMAQREDEILRNGFSTVVATLPDVLSIMAAISSGGLAEVPSILLNALMSQAFRSRDTLLDVEGGDTDQDLIEALNEIRDKIDLVLTEFNINVIGSIEDQAWSVGPLSET